MARVEGKAVSYDEVAGSPLADRTVGTLNVIYPHPEAPPEFARAEVRIDAAPLPDLVQLDERSSELLPWYRHGSHGSRDAGEVSHETWQLDLPCAELDQLLARLATPQVVVTDGGKQAGANIKTSYNGRHYQSNCQPVPEFDALMQRIRRDGRLVSYTRPLTARVPNDWSKPPRCWHIEKCTRIPRTERSIPTSSRRISSRLNWRNRVWRPRSSTIRAGSFFCPRPAKHPVGANGTRLSECISLLRPLSGKFYRLFTIAMRAGDTSISRIS